MTNEIVPQDVAHTLERAKVEQELLQKRAVELKAAPWWKAFMLRMRIRREVDQLLRKRRWPALKDLNQI